MHCRGSGSDAPTHPPQLTMAAIDPEALAEIGAAGYEPQTVDEAIVAAAEYLGSDEAAGRLFLFGYGDLVEQPNVGQRRV